MIFVSDQQGGFGNVFSLGGEVNGVPDVKTP